MFERIENAVARYGWCATAVLPDGEGGSPAFTYSTGFQATIAQPDLVIMGIDPGLAQEILGNLYQQMRIGELRLEGGKIDAGGILHRHIVRLEPLPAEIIEGFAFATIRWNGKEPTMMWQVVLPDRNGRFPGDPGVDEAFVHAQDPRTLTDQGEDGPGVSR